MSPKRIIIDTDPGIDDSLAILLALASPEVQLEGLTVVHGNCSAEQGTLNALSILELAKAEHVPVLTGCDLPLVQPSPLAPETHGGQGLATQNSPRHGVRRGRGTQWIS
jgi:purine nucleosidase